MTLIVGFVCGESAVLCADSQETRGTFKTEVDKLPFRVGVSHGGMDVVCGGAGHGELVNGFRQRLFHDVPSSVACDESAIRHELEQQLIAFHESDVFRLFPGSDDDKCIAGLIAVRTVQRRVLLFKFFNSVIEPVFTYGLAGEDHAFTERLVSRRYRDGLTIQQAVLIGLDVINEVKATSIYVGGPTRVVVITPDKGIEVQEQERIIWTENHISTQNQLFDELRFNLGSSNVEATTTLENFSNSITSMRGVYGSKYLSWPTQKPRFLDDDE